MRLFSYLKEAEAGTGFELRPKSCQEQGLIYLPMRQPKLRCLGSGGGLSHEAVIGDDEEQAQRRGNRPQLIEKKE